MPRKSAINRGAVKFGKLYARIYNTIKSHYPGAPDEIVARQAAEAVFKYASSLGYYEGMWRGVKAFLESKGMGGAYRNIMGPLRSAVVHLARLQLTGATDEQLARVIDSMAFDDNIKRLLKEFFGVA